MMKGPAKVALILLLVTALVVGFVLLPVNEWLLALVAWIHDAGTAGVIVYALSYVLATVLLFPGAILTLAAGFAYGPLWGTLLVSPTSVLAATLAFVLGRSVARDWVARRAAEHPRFAAIDRSIAEDRSRTAFVLVMLLRLSPLLPFNLLNYALGLTQIKLRTYVVASFVGMLPGTLLYVYLGSLITSTSALVSDTRPSAGAWGQAFYWVGLVATVAATVIITRVARRALERVIADHSPDTGTGATEARP